MITKAILAINSNAQVTVIGNDINTCQINWLNGTAEISKADIQTKITELETAYDNNEYQRNRASQYPELKEQLDMQYKDLLNNTTTWKDAVAKVKSDNPKG